MKGILSIFVLNATPELRLQIFRKLSGVRVVQEDNNVADRLSNRAIRGTLTNEELIIGSTDRWKQRGLHARTEQFAF